MTSAGILYADGSQLHNLPADTLGTHVAAKDLNMAGFQIVNVSVLTVASQSEDGYSLNLSSGINMPSGTVTAGLFSGSGALLTNLRAGNLTGTVPSARLASNVNLLDAAQTVTGAKTYTSSLTVTGAAGVSLKKAYFGPGVEISSAASAQSGGVLVSTNM